MITQGKKTDLMTVEEFMFNSIMDNILDSKDYNTAKKMSSPDYKLVGESNAMHYKSFKCLECNRHKHKTEYGELGFCETCIDTMDKEFDEEFELEMFVDDFECEACGSVLPSNECKQVHGEFVVHLFCKECKDWYEGE
jgi:hypothetical protein